MNKEKILLILSETIGTDVTNYLNNQSLTELGFDSLRFIQFIVAIEEAFEFEVWDSDLLMNNFETIDLIFVTLQKYFDPPSVKKVIVCDCDNVLWNGIAGEENIYINEDNVKLQNELLRLYGRGVLICLCSKNEYATLNNLEMPLTNKHITISTLNPIDKATNIQAISDELNLSLDSFVFIDDSEYELGLINLILPEVVTVKVDYDNMSFVAEINNYFSSHVSDLNRTKLYQEQKKREKARIRFASLEEYNDSLNTEVICAIARQEHAERIAELSQRTNQFNLSDRRYTADEINNHIVMYLSASDKYGDMGIVGAAVVNDSIIESFYISCRVFGRGFEHVLLDAVKNLRAGKPMYGVYNSTDKNYRYANFYLDNGVNIYA